jgi:glutamine amidotransferase
VTLAVLDYGAGNLASVARALEAAGARPRVTSAAADLAVADAVVIPGVGHFGATRAISSDARVAVRAAIDRGTPVLGICLGMQWLFEGSDEAPDTPGLGLVPGRCFALSGPVKVPHVGWNTLDRTTRPSALLDDGVDGAGSAYFTHGYACPMGPDSVATTTHGVTFTSVLERGRVYGMQFHPEKSGRTGLRLLAGFLVRAREGR